MSPNLERLLIKAGLLSTWDREFWFGGCTLEKTIILCPEADRAASLVRCYLPQLQAVLPGCEVRVGVKPLVVKAVYKGTSVVPKPQDLLGS